MNPVTWRIIQKAVNLLSDEFDISPEHDRDSLAKNYNIGGQMLDSVMANLLGNNKNVSAHLNPYTKEVSLRRIKQ